MQITQLNLSDDIIDLGVGQPDPSPLPLAVLSQDSKASLRTRMPPS